MRFFVFIFRNLLWGSVNYGQSLHVLHNTKSLRTPVLMYLARPFDFACKLQQRFSMDNIDIQIICALQLHCFLCPV